jgi:hypothetical protein
MEYQPKQQQYRGPETSEDVPDVNVERPNNIQIPQKKQCAKYNENASKHLTRPVHAKTSQISRYDAFCSSIIL